MLILVLICCAELVLLTMVALLVDCAAGLGVVFDGWVVDFGLGYGIAVLFWCVWRLCLVSGVDSGSHFGFDLVGLFMCCLFLLACLGVAGSWC